MASEQAEALRKAIEGLINAKLRDLVRPGGVDRLIANRMTGVAAYEIRDAAKKLDKAASKGVIHKNQAANRKSSIAKKAASL